MAGMSDEERHEYLALAGVEESGLEQVIRLGYHTLGLDQLLHDGLTHVAGVDDPRRLDCSAGRGRHPHGLRARLHPRRGGAL